MGSENGTQYNTVRHRQPHCVSGLRISLLCASVWKHGFMKR